MKTTLVLDQRVIQTMLFTTQEEIITFTQTNSCFSLFHFWLN